MQPHKPYLLLVALVYLFTAHVQAAEIFLSPNHKFAVEQVTDSSQNKEQTIRIVALESKKILLSWKKPIRTIEVLWNANSDVVAVNSYDANSGDFVYVVRLNEQSAIYLRKPDSRRFLQQVRRMHYPGLQSIDSYKFFADDWKGNILVLKCSGMGHGKGEPSSPISFTATFDVSSNKANRLVLSSPDFR